MDPDFIRALLHELKPWTLVVAAIIAFSLRWWLKWMRELKVPPDPWEGELNEIEPNEDSRPLCTSCLTGHSDLAHFCPGCGKPVGACTTMMPLLDNLAEGHLLRLGTSGRFHVTNTTIAGFVVTSLGVYSFFAPIYWFLLARNVQRNRQADRDATTRLSGPGSVAPPAA